MQRSERAKAAYIGTTRESYYLSLDVEKLVAPQLKGRITPIHHPFDIIVDDCNTALEVKTVVLTGKEHPKINQRQAARKRKTKYLASTNLCAFTLAVDIRGSKPRYFLREGIGSFRLENMTPCMSLVVVRRQLVSNYRERSSRIG